MAKVDLAQMRALKDAREAIMKSYWALCDAYERYGMFCKRCGEMNPPEGFYPLGCWCGDDLSPYLCNGCDREMRGSDV